VFLEIGNVFNSPIKTTPMLQVVSETLVRQFNLKGCHFRLISRDKKVLEHVASHGLSKKFLNKGPVDADKSVVEALDGKVVMILDCATDARLQYREAAAEEGLVAMLTVPLKTRGQVIGVMRLFTAERREFSRNEMAIMEAVASFCTRAIIHSMFHGILERVNGAIRSSRDLDALLQDVVTVISEDLRAKGCTIQLADDTGKRLTFRASDGLSDDYLRAATENRGEAVEAALRGETVSILEAARDTRVPSPEMAVREGIGTMLCLPLMVRDRSLGVLCICTHHPWQFSDDELFLLKSVADQCALAIRNAQMYAAVKRSYDSLTVDFQTWFEHYHTHPRGSHGKGASH
jgi:GAF domain-containing protein